MSSLTREFQGKPAVYVVQSGVVAWEDPEPISDWTCKTVTVCSSSATLLTALLKKVLSSEFLGRKSIFRCHLNAIPSPRNALQQRRLEVALRAAPPGFAEAVVAFGDTVAAAVAEASRVNDIELAYLSSYRQTLLVAAGREFASSTISEILIGLIPPLNGRAISSLRTGRGSFIVFRAFEEENQFAFQIVCDSVTSDCVAKVLDELGVGRSKDRVAASRAIGVIPGSDA